jgi:membrane fusion protein (multidrug efflux system)
MIKRMVLMLVVVGLVFGGIFGFQVFKGKMIKQALAALSAPPQTVSTIQATEQDWGSTLEAVGSLRAVRGADLSPQVAGTVSALHFDSSMDVKEGALLVELASADDVAKLQSLKENAALAKLTYERDVRQLKAQAISQQTVDNDLQTLKSDDALVAQQQALLDYKMIRAPFAGRLGIRQIDLGQYLAAGTVMVTLQALDPIYVDFFLPQQALGQIRIGQAATAKIDTYPGQEFAGEISSINSRVDTATRNVQVRAALKNPDHRLLPGMFATVVIAVGQPQRMVTLPQTAIAYNAYGSTVFSVDDKGKDASGKPQLVARQSFVTTGAARGDQITILKGVKPGEVIVSSGQVKLHNGSPLVINNSVQPSNDPAPNPVDHL